MQKNHLLILLAAASMLVAIPSFAAENAQGFVDKAATSGMFEVNSSKIAQDKAQDQSVKDFAQKMIQDHRAANAKLAKVAGNQKLKMPTDLDAKHKSDLEKLQGAQPQLDGTYVEMQREAHDEAVSLFDNYAREGDNASLKAFAQETLPTLKMHQQMVEKLASAQSGTTKATTPAVKDPNATSATKAVPGANSFTEDQAKNRIEDAGFTDISKLSKDDQGIWRGQASKDGKATPVALDYQGNVIAGSN